MTTTIERTPTVHCINALSDLVHSARRLATRAELADAARLHRVAVSIADTLDRARTRLVEDGDEYLDAAWAFVDAGRKHVAQLGIRVDRKEARHGHAA